VFIKDLSVLDSARQYTSEGFLRVPAAISRVGVQTYTPDEMGVPANGKSLIYVYRPPEEVFSDVSLGSFANKPVTNDHPPELVTAKNAKTYAVGMSGDQVTKLDDRVTTTLTIMDADAIREIEAGKAELSNGYTADIDWTPGITPEGINYDAVQRNIVGNHIALVTKGRAGMTCRLADSQKGGVKMPTVMIDGVNFDAPEQTVQAVAKLQKRLADAEMSAAEMEKDMKAKEDEMAEKEKEAQATNDALKAQLDAAKEAVPTGAALDALVADRADLLEKARTLVPDYEWQGKDAATIRREVVAAKCPTVNMDAASAEYIAARFDLLVEAAPGKTTVDHALTTQVVGTPAATETRPAHIVARDAMIARNREAWKGATK